MPKPAHLRVDPDDNVYLNTKRVGSVSDLHAALFLTKGLEPTIGNIIIVAGEDADPDEDGNPGGTGGSVYFWIDRRRVLELTSTGLFVVEGDATTDVHRILAVLSQWTQHVFDNPTWRITTQHPQGVK